MGSTSSQIVSPFSLGQQAMILGQQSPVLGQALQTIINNQNLLYNLLRNLSSSVAGINPNLMIDGAHLKNINADTIIAGEIDGGLIAAATVDATSLNILQILVVGLTLTNNSPSAGKVAWSACQVYYGGVAYGIASGSALTTDVFITWTVGAGTFGHSATFTPAPNIFGIATNNAGSADITWNKLGFKGITEDHLSFGLITGVQPQPIVAVSVPHLSFAGTTNILNVSGMQGVIVTVAILVTNTFTTTGLTTALQFQTDSLTPESIPIFTGNAWDPALVALFDAAGTGGTAGDLAKISLQVGFGQSVSINIVNSVSTGDGGILVYVFYASSPA